MSDNTSETGSADAPAESVCASPREQAAAPAAAETSAAPAQPTLPLASAPEAPAPAPAAAPAPSAPPPRPLPAVAVAKAAKAANPASRASSTTIRGRQNQGQNPYNQNGQQGQGQGNRRDRFRNRRDRDRNNRFRDEGMPNDGGEQQPFVPRPHANVPEGFPVYSLSDLKRMPAQKLLEIAEQLQISEGVARARKQDVIFALLKVLTRHGDGVAADGVLEILPDGFGFLRAAEASYLAGPDDTYISPSQIRRFNLRTGDHISGRIRFPKDGERYFALNIVDTINGEPIEASKNKVLFENLTALFPRRRFTLERGNGSSEDITGRILDLMAPQGKGQRSLIVSQPKAGKTMMMQQVATAITTNHPDVHLIVLLIDERPEE